jgi:hypothetical protein
LLKSISKAPDALDKEDIRRLKEAAFGPQVGLLAESGRWQEQVSCFG